MRSEGCNWSWGAVSPGPGWEVGDPEVTSNWSIRRGYCVLGNSRERFDCRIEMGRYAAVVTERAHRRRKGDCRRRELNRPVFDQTRRQKAPRQTFYQEPTMTRPGSPWRMADGRWQMHAPWYRNRRQIASTGGGGEGGRGRDVTA